MASPSLTGVAPNCRKGAAAHRQSAGVADGGAVGNVRGRRILLHGEGYAARVDGARGAVHRRGEINSLVAAGLYVTTALLTVVAVLGVSVVVPLGVKAVEELVSVWMQVSIRG